MNNVPNGKFSLSHRVSCWLGAVIEKLRAASYCSDPLSRLCFAACVCSVLASCGKHEDEHLAVDVELPATDIHFSVAQHTLVLPFIALEDYAYRHQSFSLDRKSDTEHALDAVNKLLRDAADPKHPLALDSLSVVVRTYGWNDSDSRQIQMCPLLTREWARSVCDNPWAAIQQALPVNRFRLVDLRRLQVEDPRGMANCRDDKPHRPLPRNPGEAVMVCAAQVHGGRDDEFHSAVVRIDGDLGAIWTVWRYGQRQNGETAEAMTEREGKAIASFVQYALGKSEDFRALHATLCQLRRPGSNDGVGPRNAGCTNAALPTGIQATVTFSANPQGNSPN